MKKLYIRNKIRKFAVDFFFDNEQKRTNYAQNTTIITFVFPCCWNFGTNPTDNIRDKSNDSRENL